MVKMAETIEKEQACPPTPEHETIEDKVEKLDPSVVFRYMLTKVESDILYKTADEVKKREFEESLVDAYQVTLNYLHLDDCAKSYTINLIIVEDEIVNKATMLGYSNFQIQKAKIVDGELCVPHFPVKIILVDKFITSQLIKNRYQATVTVNKMKSKPLSCLTVDGGMISGCH
jgi:hypothetical protein